MKGRGLARLTFDNDKLIKSLRFDENCFIDEFIDGVTPTAGKSKQPRTPLRKGDHKKFTVFASGVYERGSKPSPYNGSSEEIESNKAERSRHQATSLINRDIQPPVFGHNTSRKTALVGVILEAEDAMINRSFIYDAGTVGRPYEFDDRDSAEKYLRIKSDSILFSNPASLKAALRLSENQQKHNEILARIRWNKKTSMLGIFTDTFESRCVAQIYAERLYHRLKKQAEELHEQWDDSYQVPIAFYIPKNEKNFTFYTEEMQKEDQQKATEIFNDSHKRNQAFSKGEFAFLLLLEPQQLLEEMLEDINILNKLAEAKSFHIIVMLLEKFEKNSFNYKELIKNIDTATLHGMWKYVSKQNNAEPIALLLKHDPALIDIKDDDGNTALMRAIKNNHKDLISSLVNMGANVDIQDNQSATALIWAAYKGQKDILQLLLNKNANVDIQSNGCYTALIWAAYKGNKEIVQLLLNKNANVDIQDKDGYTALIWAARNGNKEIVQLLLDRNANVDIQDKDGNTALIWAVRKGNKEIMRQLLDRNANVDIKDCKDDTALTWAVRDGYEDIIQPLLIAKLTAYRNRLAKRDSDYSSKAKAGLEIAITNSLFTKYNKKEKLDAVDALINSLQNEQPIDQIHMGALTQFNSELASIVKLIPNELKPQVMKKKIK